MKSHWSDKYLGYEFEKYNCAQFVQMVMHNEFKIEYRFPQSTGSIFSNSHKIKSFYKDFVSERTETPEDGDLVLMHSGLRKLGHIGLYCDVRGQKCVLHALKEAGQSVRHRLRNVGNYGLHVEGFYKWRK